MLCGPSTLIPKYISSIGVQIENNIENALKWCDVANVLRIQLERQKDKFFPSYFKSEESKSSTNKSFIQSSASDVDGSFFKPGTSLSSKNLFKADSSRDFFIFGK